MRYKKPLIPSKKKTQTYECPCGQVFYNQGSFDEACRTVGCQNCKHFNGITYYTRSETLYQEHLQRERRKNRMLAIKVHVASILQNMFCSLGVLLALLLVIFSTMNPTEDTPRIALFLASLFSALVAWKLDDVREGK